MAWGTAAAAQAPPTEAPPAAGPAVAEDGLGDGPPISAPPAEAPAPALAAAQGPPPAPPTISDAITGGKLLLEVRARYEDVDQTRTATLTRRGEAFTVRTRLGWETADWRGFRGLVEFEDVRQVGAEHYAVNVPGAATPPLNGADKAKFPVINDPDVTELNRLQLTWTPSAALQGTLGRQRILIDDQRFVGNVGWRQDEQTFDAGRIDAAYGKFKATYAYVTHVNRVLAELRDWDSDSHLFNATWSLSEPLKLQGFVYALDFGNSVANSSVTKGVKASGKTWVGLFQLAYNATYANQRDYRHNTPNYSLDYWGADLAGTFDIYTAKVSYESLEGNGTRGFTTPLATTHAFQGWADAWVQPLGGNKGFVDGLKDLNFSVNIKPRFKATYFFNSDIIVRYHDFNDQRTGANLAHEWDAQLQAAINPKLTAALKYADFKRVKGVPLGTATPPPSRTKIWFTLEYKL
ncbi:MAG TPA: alginate export family protein [Phenylobacterium sp.]